MPASYDELWKRYQRQNAEIEELRAALRWFCSRVEAGEVRSKRTYARFKELLGDEPFPSTKREFENKS